MPVEGKYYLPNEYWISIHTNEEVITTWGVEEGRDYVISTGREIGWYVYYARGTRTVAMPEQVFCNVVRYSTPEGAQLSVTDYNYAERSADEGWGYKDVQIEGLGDVYRVVTYSEITSGGDKQGY